MSLLIFIAIAIILLSLFFIFNILMDPDNISNPSTREHSLVLTQFLEDNLRGDFIDEQGNKIDNFKREINEQIDAHTYIQPGDRVLEFGARYGTVTNAISKKIGKTGKLACVEVDGAIQDALNRNLKVNGVEAIVIFKFIGDADASVYRDSYSTTTLKRDYESEKISHMTMPELIDTIGFTPNVLVADCEGCLVDIIKQLITHGLLNNFRAILYERDCANEVNYKWVDEQISRIPGMVNVKSGFHTVWIK